MGHKKYIKLYFADITEEQKNQLIALLADVGYTGFEEVGETMSAFISEDEFNATNLEELLSIVPANYTKTIVEEENWNAQWESSFEPILVNDFVGIRAFFHPPITHVKNEIIITPKMSFGTGHHATTYMMLEQMEALDLNRKTVMDFGTGTGVLAILAEKMGASLIDAIDCDQWSIENSAENVAANNCNKINLSLAEAIPSGLAYDIILANINLHVIQNNLLQMRSAIKKGGFVLLSGFMLADEAIMAKNLAKSGINLLKITRRGEWISMLSQLM